MKLTQRSVERWLRNLGVKAKMILVVSIPALCILSIVLLSVYHVFTDDQGLNADEISIRGDQMLDLTSVAHFNDSDPSGIVDDGGVLHMVFQSDRYGESDIFYLTEHAGIRTHPIMISREGAADVAPSIWIDGNDSIWVLFTGNRTGASNASLTDTTGFWVVSSDDGVIWSDPVLLPIAGTGDVEGSAFFYDDQLSTLYLSVVVREMDPSAQPSFEVLVYSMDPSVGSLLNITDMQPVKLDAGSFSVSMANDALAYPADRMHLPAMGSISDSLIISAPDFLAISTAGGPWSPVETYNGSVGLNVSRGFMMPLNGSLFIGSEELFRLDIVNGSGHLFHVGQFFGSGVYISSIAGGPGIFSTEYVRGDQLIVRSELEDVRSNGTGPHLRAGPALKLTFNGDLVGNSSVVWWNSSYLVTFEIAPFGDRDLQLVRMDEGGNILLNIPLVSSPREEHSPSISVTSSGLLILSYKETDVAMFSYTLDPGVWSAPSRIEAPTSGGSTFLAVKGGGQLMVNSTGLWYNSFEGYDGSYQNWTVLEMRNFTDPVMSGTGDSFVVVHRTIDSTGSEHLSADHFVITASDNGKEPLRVDIVIFLSVLILLVGAALVLEVTR